jgi:antirestriction protein
LFTNKVKNVNLNEYDKSLSEVDNLLFGFSKSILDGKYKLKINPNEIIDRNVLYRLEKDYSKFKQILKDLQNSNTKRLSNLTANWAERNVGQSKNEYVRAKNLGKKLKKGNMDKTLVEDVEKQLGWAIKDIKGLLSSLDELKIVQGIPQAEINKIAKLLSNSKNYISSYKKNMKDIQYEFRNSENKEEQNIAYLAERVVGLMSSLETSYIKNSLPLMKEFFRPFFGDAKVINFEGKKVTIDELLTKSEVDVTWMDNLLYSLGNSNNQLLRVVDVIIKSNKVKARRDTTMDIKGLLDALINYEKSGGRDNGLFMYETKDGKINGNLKQDRNYDLYNKNEEEMLKDTLVDIKDEPDTAKAKTIERVK